MARKKAKAKKETRKPIASAPELEGSKGAFDRFIPQAISIDASRIVRFRVDASLAAHNVKRGLDSVLAEEPRVLRELPLARLSDLKTLPDLALAVIFAAGEVERHVPASGTTRHLLHVARDLHGILLASAEALARAGHLPAKDYARFASSQGPIDTATDCIELAALFRKHRAKVKGKTPVTAEIVSEASEVGRDLLARLRPDEGRKGAAQAELASAVATRDRMFTLLVQGHERLRRVGAWLFGVERLDAVVPPLGEPLHLEKDKHPVEVS